MPEDDKSALGKDAVTQRLQNWLEQTGYPLEMRVARRFNEASLTGWEIRPSFHFRRPNEDASRECDLYAWRTGNLAGVQVEINLYIECKSGANPWVIFKDKYWYAQSDSIRYPLFDPYRSALSTQSVPDKSGRSLERSAASRQIRPSIIAASPAHFGAGYSLVESHKKPNAPDLAYKALMQASFPVIAAREGREEHRFSYLAIDVPVIVTSNRLFEASLNEDGASIRLAEVDRTAVALPAESLGVYDEGMDAELLIEIVNERAIGSLIADCEAVDGAQ